VPPSASVGRTSYNLTKITITKEGGSADRRLNAGGGRQPRRLRGILGPSSQSPVVLRQRKFASKDKEGGEVVEA
jgi:hypothetical protein